jgi:hypothetical protein
MELSVCYYWRVFSLSLSSHIFPLGLLFSPKKRIWGKTFAYPLPDMLGEKIQLELMGVNQFPITAQPSFL